MIGRRSRPRALRDIRARRRPRDVRAACKGGRLALGCPLHRASRSRLRISVTLEFLNLSRPPRADHLGTGFRFGRHSTPGLCPQIVSAGTESGDLLKSLLTWLASTRASNGPAPLRRLPLGTRRSDRIGDGSPQSDPGAAARRSCLATDPEVVRRRAQNGAHVENSPACPGEVCGQAADKRRPTRTRWNDVALNVRGRGTAFAGSWHDANRGEINFED